MLPIEQLKTMSETSRHATRQLAEVALEGHQKIARVNIDAIHEFIKTGSEQFKESCANLAQVDPAKGWPQVFIGNIQRSTALNLSMIEITRRLQQELACVVEEHLRALRNGTLDAVEKCVTVAKAGQSESRSRSNERQMKQAA